MACSQGDPQCMQCAVQTQKCAIGLLRNLTCIHSAPTRCLVHTRNWDFDGNPCSFLLARRFNSNWVQCFVSELIIPGDVQGKHVIGNGFLEEVTLELGFEQ